MKTVLLWDARFPTRQPTRLTLPDAFASAVVRAGVAAAADPAQAGALSSGGALDPALPTEVVLFHGVDGDRSARMYLPYSVVVIGGELGVLASIATPVAGASPQPPTLTLAALTLTGTLTQGVAASGVTITGATAGSAVSLNVAGLTISGSGATRTVSGTPTGSGFLVATEVLATATNSGRPTLIGNVLPLGPTAAPLAPTVTATGGNAQALLSIADDPASQQVRKWRVERADTPAGPWTFKTYAYRKDQLLRIMVSNGNSESYRVAAYNDLGEGPFSATVTASPLAANFNPLRLLGTVLFAGELFYEPIGADFKAGSTVTATSSDGTILTSKTRNGAVLFSGTFATTGVKTITFTETPSGGGAANVSTQTVEVVAKPTASYATVKPTAQAIKDRLNAKPTYVDAPITITDIGAAGAMPAGYTGMFNTEFAGGSAPPRSYSTLSGFRPPENYIQVPGWDPVEKKVIQRLNMAYTTTENTVLRTRLFKRTFIFTTGDTGNIPTHFKFRYSDNEKLTWNEAVDPLYVRVGDRQFKIDPGVDAPAAGRIWEIECSGYAQINNFDYRAGLGYETGDTPQAVADNSPVASGYIDSFMNTAIAVDTSKAGLRTATRRLGLLNCWNQGVNSHRYTDPAITDFPLGLDRIGDNVLGVGDVSNPPRNDVMFFNCTINDFAQTDYVQAKAIMKNVFYRARRLKPIGLIVYSLGFWAPQNRIGVDLYNAFKAAADEVAVTDKGFIFNDGIAAGWAVASGATGSSPYFLATAGGNVTGSTAGRILTVTAGANVEVGMYVGPGQGARARVLKQLTGTPGGTGTYQMTTNISAANGGDIADGSTVKLATEDFDSAYPVHPNPAGQTWMGNRMADGAETLVNLILAN